MVISPGDFAIWGQVIANKNSIYCAITIYIHIFICNTTLFYCRFTREFIKLKELETDIFNLELYSDFKHHVFLKPSQYFKLFRFATF